MVKIYRPPQPSRAPVPAPQQAQAPAPTEAPAASSPAVRPISRDVFTLRLMRLFPNDGGLDAARNLNTDDHQQVLALGAETMHPDPLAAAARLSVWMQFGRGFPLPQPDQTLLDKLADAWCCADPQPIERNGRAAYISLQTLGVPLAGDQPDMPDPLDLLSPKPKPPGQGPDSVGNPTPPPPAAPYQVNCHAAPVVVPPRPAYKFYGRRELTDVELNNQVPTWKP